MCIGKEVKTGIEPWDTLTLSETLHEQCSRVEKGRFRRIGKLGKPYQGRWRKEPDTKFC